MTWSIDFSSNWPFLSQLNDTPPDGETPVNKTEDCGPTSCSMICLWETGVSIDPDIAKDIMFQSETATGPTTAAQLRSFLSTYCTIPTTRLWPQGTTGTGSLTNLIWEYLVAGKPLIVLKKYSDTDALLHWVVVIGLDPTYVYWADPWTGSKQQATYADFASLYAGTLIGVERERDPYLDG